MESINRLADDFRNSRGPFDSIEFPEQRLVNKLGDTHKANYLTLFCTLDYNRGVDNLVSNIFELHELDDGYGTNHFHPPDVVEVPLDELQAQFSSIGFRYPNRDAKGWQENCQLLLDNYGNDFGVLLDEADHDAPTLVELLRDEGFKYIKGKKLAPFYARVVSEHVAELDDLWRLDIPVDTHIRRLSRDLFGEPEMEDDKIRGKWREIGQMESLSPAVVDGALWQIGYSWDDWGEQYWTEVTDGQ